MRAADILKLTPAGLYCEAGDFYEVLDGLNGDEAVVTQGSFLLKTEILKGSIGAGCCDVEQLAK